MLSKFLNLQSMTFNTNLSYALGSFTLGVLWIVLAHTSFTRLLESLFYTFFKDDTITGMFRAMDAAYDTMMLIGAVFLLMSAYFALRYVSTTTQTWRRIAAISGVAIVGCYAACVIIAAILL